LGHTLITKYNLITRTPHFKSIMNQVSALDMFLFFLLEYLHAVLTDLLNPHSTLTSGPRSWSQGHRVLPNLGVFPLIFCMPHVQGPAIQQASNLFLISSAGWLGSRLRNVFLVTKSDEVDHSCVCSCAENCSWKLYFAH
jgi:hypothetical protein